MTNDIRKYVTPMFQHDEKWRDAPMGNTTIGRYGCLLTCISMMLRVANVVVKPDELALALESVGGLYPGGELKWRYIEKVPGRMKFLERHRTELERSGLRYDINESILRVNALVDMGIPVCVNVDNVGSDGRPDHWVLMVDRFGMDDNMRDPWNAGTSFEGVYGHPEKALYGWSTIILPTVAKARNQKNGLALIKILEGDIDYAVNLLISPTQYEGMV